MDEAWLAQLREREDGSWWHRVLRGMVVEELRRRLPDGSRLIDAGCGTGGLLAEFRRQRVPWQVAGFDLSGEAVRLVRERGFTAVQRAEVEAIPWPDGCLEAVVCLDVLDQESVDEHLAVAELGRVLRPGGLLIVQVPASERLLGSAGSFPGSVRRYSPGRLRELFPEESWRIDLLHGWNAIGYPWARLGQWLRGARPGQWGPVERSAAVSDFLASLGSWDAAVCRALRLGWGTSLLLVATKTGRTVPPVP
jgi:SAM-dependent methyltransferase